MKRTAVTASLLAVFSILIADAVFWSRLGLEASLGLLGVALLSLLVLLPHRRLTLYSAFLFVSTCALSVSLFVSDQRSVKTIAVFAILFLYTLFLLDFMKIRRHPSGTWQSLWDWFYTAFALSFGRIAHGMRTLFSRKSDNDRRFGGVLLGVALALPVLLILLVLLMSADAAFEGLIGDITVGSVLKFFVSVFFGVGLFFLLFGRLAALPQTERTPASPRERKGIDNTVIITFLSLIHALYAAYLFSQLAYFFNAFSGLLGDGFTVAEYARRGFFEMSAVCSINLLILGAAAVLCRKKDGKRSKILTSLLTGLGFFSLLFIAISLSKMILYIQTFGLTHLRLYTSLFMVVMAVLVISILLRLYLPRIPYFKMAICTATILLTLLCYADADRLVAGYNVTAYQNGKLETIDVQALRLDSDAVIPYLKSLTSNKDPEVARQAKALLAVRDTREEEDWRSFNLTSYLNS